MKEYHQDIQLAKQKISSLEKDILKSIYSTGRTYKELEIELDDTRQSIDKLKNTPIFLNEIEQNILNSKLKTQELFFTSQANLIREFQENKFNLNQSCQYIPKLRNDFNYKNLSFNQDLALTIKDLLSNLILQCYQKDRVANLTIKSQISKIKSLTKENYFVREQILVNESIEHANKVIDLQEKIEDISRQLKISNLEHKLNDFEKSYLQNIDDIEKSIKIYRLFTYLFLLIIIIFIAQQIINNLIKTNRSIVKILEGFTEELEKKVEQRTAQLEESIQNTEAALAQAQNANKAKSRFLANMSHELRTPLNAILGFTQLMCRDGSISNEHRENVQIINRSGEHLLKLINDILEMSKIEVGQITLNETKFDLHIMLKSIEDMLRLKAESNNIILTFDLASNIPQYIYTDEGKLRQIIINLLGNALKFTTKGAIVLTVKLQENTQVENNNLDFLFSDTYGLYFSVQDTGPGIPTEEMEQLFSPFEQTKVGRVSNEGTGLGLSICQKFVELMGGKLEVESVVGEGSIFFFEILLKVENTDISQIFNSREIDETQRVVGIAGDRPQYRILAVDDVSASRLLLRKILTEVGFAVEEAGDGQQAIELYSSWNPDLILMDMRMPIIDGYEATRQIKSLPKGKDTIIIALTASAFEEERVVILSAGCDDFMRKPFHEAELLEKIGKYLNIDYLYEETIDVVSNELALLEELSQESLAVMSSEWRSQLYDAAARVDNQEILQLLSDIPQEYESLAQGLENLVEHFRCDKIIDLTKSVN
nr:response regulator [Waterburya agarophytonicola]